MKNKIYYIGILSCVLIITGAIFKIMHWPGAGVILTLSILLLCIIFLPVAFISSFRNNEKTKKWLFIAAFITLFIDFIGALFKIMHWPGAGILLTVGLLVPVIFFLPVYLYHHYKEKEESLKNFFYIMFFLVYLSVMSALLALNVSKSVLTNVMAINEFSNVSNYYTIKSNDIFSHDNIDMVELKRETEKLLNVINDIRIDILLSMDPVNKEAINKDKQIDYWKTKGYDNKEFPMLVLFGKGKANTLKKGLEAYKEYTLKLIDKDNTELYELCNETFDTKAVLKTDGNLISWEEYNFDNLPLMFVFNRLTDIENNIRIVEFEILSTLNDQS